MNFANPKPARSEAWRTNLREIIFEADTPMGKLFDVVLLLAIVTMTTVGYGDVVPQTAAGKLLSALLILLGYSLIIVPTGFVSAELIGSKLAHSITTQVCPHCLAEGHDHDALHCKYCGVKL